MKLTVRKPTCVGCPHDLHFLESIPKRQYISFYKFYGVGG